MKPYTVEAIVLRARPLDGADKLLVLFSRERGRLRALAYGAGKPTSRKRGAVQPFSHARLLLEEGRGGLSVVRQAEEISSLSHLHEDLEAMAYAGYFAELVESFTPEGEPSEGLFVALSAALRGLARPAGRDLLALAFTARTLALSGLAPCLSVCASCGADLAAPAFFSLSAGGALCPACQGGDPGALACRLGTLRTLEQLFDWPFDRLAQLQVGPVTRRELTTILLAQICFHLEREPRSLAFLHSMGTL